MQKQKTLISIIIIIIASLGVWVLVRLIPQSNPSLLFLASEDNGNIINDSEKEFNIEQYITRSAPSNETTAIKGETAILIQPTDKSIEKFKKLNNYDEESIDTIVDDNMYYAYEASEYLKTQNISVIDSQTRYLSFIAPDGSTMYLDTEIKDDLSLLIFFSDTKMPKIVSMIDIEKDYIDYYADSDYR